MSELRQFNNLMSRAVVLLEDIADSAVVNSNNSDYVDITIDKDLWKELKIFVNGSKEEQ